MTDRTETKIEIGGVVTWSDVRIDGVLVRATAPRNTTCFALRSRGYGCWVGADGEWTAFTNDWRWREDSEHVTIVALGLTGQETAADLQRMAKVFEVREALTAGPALGPGFCRVYMGEELIGGFSGSYDTARSVWAKRLYAAGWRKGMTAEDAARLLVGAA